MTPEFYINLEMIALVLQIIRNNRVLSTMLLTVIGPLVKIHSMVKRLYIHTKRITFWVVRLNARSI